MKLHHQCSWWLLPKQLQLFTSYLFISVPHQETILHYPIISMSSDHLRRWLVACSWIVDDRMSFILVTLMTTQRIYNWDDVVAPIIWNIPTISLICRMTMRKVTHIHFIHFGIWLCYVCLLLKLWMGTPMIKASDNHTYRSLILSLPTR